MTCLLLTPQFFGMLEPGVLELCDFFYLRTEADVPVNRFTITSDGRRIEFVVKFDTYKPTLLLLYFAVLAKSPTYAIGEEEKKLLVSYFGKELVSEAESGRSGQTLLGMLVGREVQVELELRGSYVLPESKARTLEEVIHYAWERLDDLDPDRVAPLIHHAVHLFLRGQQLHLLPIADTADPEVWPSRIWAERVWEIAGRINHPLRAAA